MRMRYLVFTAVVMLLLSVVALGAVPRLISVQGRLTDATDAPLSGSYSFLFTIFDASTGGSSLWSETQNVVVDKGIFNATLGQVTPLTIGFDKDYWLEVVVNGQTLSPRIRITSSAYSVTADRLSNVTTYPINVTTSSVPALFVKSTSGTSAVFNGTINVTEICISGDCKTSWPGAVVGGWVLSGNYLYNNTPGVLVGIGTATPTQRLDVRGDVNFSGKIIMPYNFSIGNGAIASGTQSLAIGLSASASGFNSIAVGRSASASGDDGIAVGEFASASGPLSVAIGSDATSSGFNSMALGKDVAGSGINSTAIGSDTEALAANSIVIGIGPGATDRLINNIPNSFMIGFQKTPRFFINLADGNVGIGTTSPLTKLDVVGNVNASRYYDRDTTGRYLDPDGISLLSATNFFGPVDFGNNFVTNAERYSINDPGVNEGLTFSGTGAGWTIDVSPADRSNADGNLNLYGTANNIVAWRPLNGTQINATQLCLGPKNGEVCQTSWPAGGGVTSISQGTGIIATPNPITLTGTIALDTVYTNANYVNEGQLDSITSSMVVDNSLTAADLFVPVVSSVDGVFNDGGNIDLIAGSGVTITPDDIANTITFTAAGAGPSGWVLSGANLYNNTAGVLVGIGTATPTQKLEVVGNVNASVYYDRANNARYLIPSGGSQLSAVGFNNNPLTGADTIQINDTGAGEGLTFPSSVAGWSVDVSDLSRSSINDGNLNLYGTSNNIVAWRPLNGTQVNSTQLCLGAKGSEDCRTVWPGGISGSGTTNNLTKFTGASTIGNSIVYDNGVNVGIGTTTPTQKLDVRGDVNISGKIIMPANVSIGKNAVATTGDGIAIGRDVRADSGSVVIGFDKPGSDSGRVVSVGSSAIASGFQSVAIGYSAAASGVQGNTIAIGPESSASNTNSTAIGAYTFANADNAIVIGRGNGVGSELTNNIPNSFMVGYQTTPRFFINLANGNVGIGSVSPVKNLDVVGTINATSSICLAGDCRSVWPSGAGAAGWTVSGSNVYNNTPGVSVGIGTTTLGYTFNVVGTSFSTFTTTKQLAIFNDTNNPSIVTMKLTDNAGQPQLNFTNTISAANSQFNRWTDRLELQTSDAFSVTKTVGGTPAIWADTTNARVGIGTSIPGTALDVVGTGRASTDFRAPIFYDSLDTTKYLDPNSISKLSAVNLSNNPLGEVDRININDVGAGEGLTFPTSLAGWSVDVSDVSRSSINDGNLNLYGTANNIVAWRPLNGTQVNSTQICLGPKNGEVCQTSWPAGGGGWAVSGANLYNDTTGGKVGIGTATPGGKFQVVTSTDTNPSLVTAWDTRHVVVGASGNTAGIGLSYDQTNNIGVIHALSPNVAWRNLVLQPGGGNVGIGLQTTPQRKLHVVDNSGLDNGIVIDSSSVSDSGNLRFVDNVNHWNIDNSGGNLRFFTETGYNTGGIERVKIDTMGRVGIGAMPSANLTVIGQATFGPTAFTPPGSEPVSTSGSGSGVSMNDRDGTSPRWVTYPSGGSLRFWNGADRVTVGASGEFSMGSWASQSRTTNGYMKMGNMMIQWGWYSCPGCGEGVYTVTFPTAFSAAPYNIQCNVYNPSGANNFDTWCQIGGSAAFTATTAPVYVQWGGGVGSLNKMDGFYWMAIGPA